MIRFDQDLTKAIFTRWKAEGIRFTSRLMKDAVPEKALFLDLEKVLDRPDITASSVMTAVRYLTVGGVMTE